VTLSLITHRIGGFVPARCLVRHPPARWPNEAGGGLVVSDRGSVLRGTTAGDHASWFHILDCCEALLAPVPNTRRVGTNALLL